MVGGKKQGKLQHATGTHKLCRNTHTRWIEMLQMDNFVMFCLKLQGKF